MIRGREVFADFNGLAVEFRDSTTETRLFLRATVLSPVDVLGCGLAAAAAAAADCISSSTDDVTELRAELDRPPCAVPASSDLQGEDCLCRENDNQREFIGWDPIGLYSLQRAETERGSSLEKDWPKPGKVSGNH